MGNNQIQTSSLNSSKDVSTVRGISPRQTIPPTMGSALLVQVEKARQWVASKLPVNGSWGTDLVLTLKDHPDLVVELAQALGTTPGQLEVHFTLCNGVLYQGIFINGHLRRGRETQKALNLIDWSEVDLSQVHQELSGSTDLELDGI